MENFDFSVMIAIWEDNTFSAPADLEKIGQLKFQLYDKFWDHEKTNINHTPLYHHSCTFDDKKAFPEALKTSVNESLIGSYQCLDQNKLV